MRWTLTVLIWLGGWCQLPAAEPPITAAAFAPDGRSVVVGSQSGLREYSWPALESLRTLETRLAQIHDLAFSGDGQRLAIVGGRPAETGEIEVLAWPQPERQVHHVVGMDVLYQVVWQPADAGFYVAGPDHAVLALSSAGELDHTVNGHSADVVAVTLSASGTLISGGHDQTLRVWQPDGWQLLRTLNNHTQPVLDLAIQPGGGGPTEVLASSGADRTVRFWQPGRGRLMRFAKLPSPALAIDWTPGGSRLVAACADGHLRSIDPDSVEIIQDVTVIDGWLYTLVVSPDGNFALVGGEHGSLQAIPLEVTTDAK